MHDLTLEYHTGIPYFSEFDIVKTTLYDLIEAVGEAVNPNEERWIPYIVKGMLDPKVSASISKNKYSCFETLKN